MKTTITLALFALLVLLAGPARGSYVSDIVDEMPAKNSAGESALAAKLMSSGAPAVREICSMLVPLGTAGKDDTHARYAISALVRFAGRPVNGPMSIRHRHLESADPLPRLSFA